MRLHTSAKSWGLRGLGLLLVLAVLGPVIGGFWVRTEAGRSYASNEIQAYASSGMPGSLKIGSLDQVDFFQGLTGVRVKATEVRFLAPNGKETIHVGDADVTLDLASILGGTIAIREATASNGTVTIEMGEDKKLTIENTFGAAHKKPSWTAQESMASESVGLELRHMNARNMRVVLHSAPDESYTVVGVDGTVFVTRPKGGEFVTTELVDVSGKLEEPKFLGDTLGFSKLKGRIAMEQTPMVKISALLSLDEGTIDTRLSVDPGGKPPIKLRLSAKGDVEVELLTSAAKITSFFGSDFEIETGPIKDDPI